MENALRLVRIIVLKLLHLLVCQYYANILLYNYKAYRQPLFPT